MPLPFFTDPDPAAHPYLVVPAFDPERVVELRGKPGALNAGAPARPSFSRINTAAFSAFIKEAYAPGARESEAPPPPPTASAAS